MARTIWKFDLALTDNQELALPKGSKILHVGLQQGAPRVWVLIDAADQPIEEETWEVRLYGTGHPVISRAEDYVGILQMHSDTLILHVFARVIA